MATDEKITELDPSTTINDADLIIVIDNSLGTPVSKKMTRANYLLDQVTINLKDATELTLDADGAVTVTQSWHTIDTFEDAASDNLVTINGGVEGDILFFRPENDARTIVVDHDADNISCVGQADITCGEVEDFCILIYDAGLTKWLAVSGGGAAASYASIAETSAATEAAKAVTPDGLAGSDYGKRSVILQPIADDLAHTVADGKQYFPTPEWLAGWNLVDVRTRIITAGTTNLFSVMVHNLTQTADMLSTVCSIDTGELLSDTAAAPVVIDAAEDDITSGDLLRIDFKAIHSTPGKGAYIELVFSMP